MKGIEELREMLCKELDEIARKPEMSAGDLEAVHKLTDTIKNIDKITMLEDDGYSERGYSRDRSYSRGNSYANRGQHYVRGHYSRDGGSSRGYSRYSRDGGGLEAEMERMMDEASTDREREAIRRCVEMMRYD